MRYLLVLVALIATSEADACAPDDYLCQGAEKMERRARQDYEDTRHMLDTIRQNQDALDRDFNEMSRSKDQAVTDSLIMNLDRR